MLRKLTLTLLACALLAVPLQADEWSGWITDEHCGEKGASSEHASCALKCAERGAALVLYNSADKKIYTLSDQDAAKALAGKKVKVVGTAEEDKITVESITEEK